MQAQLKVLYEKKVQLRQYKQLPFAAIKRLLKLLPIDFLFNYVHFHALNEIVKDGPSFIGFERTEFPFAVHVFQNALYRFDLKFVAHDGYCDRSFLEQFARDYSYHLRKILCDKGE
jgi:hypothetical protein